MRPKIPWLREATRSSGCTEEPGSKTHAVTEARPIEIDPPHRFLESDIRGSAGNFGAKEIQQAAVPFFFASRRKAFRTPFVFGVNSHIGELLVGGQIAEVLLLASLRNAQDVDHTALDLEYSFGIVVLSSRLQIWVPAIQVLSVAQMNPAIVCVICRKDR
jgi:hypothetical protein